MKKTFIKKAIDELVKSVEQEFGKKCDLMQLQMKTCIMAEGELFAHAEAIVDFDGDEKSYMVKKDFDL